MRTRELLFSMGSDHICRMHEPFYPNVHLGYMLPNSRQLAFVVSHLYHLYFFSVLKHNSRTFSSFLSTYIAGRNSDPKSDLHCRPFHSSRHQPRLREPRFQSTLFILSSPLLNLRLRALLFSSCVRKLVGRWCQLPDGVHVQLWPSPIAVRGGRRQRSSERRRPTWTVAASSFSCS